MIENDPVQPARARLSVVKEKILDRLVRGDASDLLQSQAAIPRRPHNGPVPLSYAQEQVWLHAQMAGEVPIYNEPITIVRRGALDVRVLERCLKEMIRRHEVWRTTFDTFDGQPVQIVHSCPESFHVPEFDLRHLPATTQEVEARRLAENDARRMFDLKKGPLLRAILVRLGDQEYRICMTFHQLVFDSVTAYRIIVPELANLYDAFSKGRCSPLPDLPIQYADFSYWQRRNQSSTTRNENLAYWKRRLEGELSALQWPNSCTRPPVQSHRGALDHFALPESLTSRIRAFSREEGVSLYVTLLTGFAAILHRYTGQTDIILGALSAGRKLPELEPLAGYFVNPLALRIDFSGSPRFRELVARVREVVVDALSRDGIPFQEIAKIVQPKIDPSRNPLFQIIFSLQPEMPCSYREWDLRTEEVGNGGSKMDLIVVVDSRPDRIFGPITFNPDLFDASTISRMVDHWKTLLSYAVDHPEQWVAELPILTAGERQRIVCDWNDTRVDYRKDLCLHELIEAQVERSPEAVAVTFEDYELSYRELNTRANVVAHHLRRMGVRADELVGVCMQRSVEMVVSLLGILKAGGAYVPLDPDYPSMRLRNMIGDCCPKAILTQQAFLNQLGNHSTQVICLDADWEQFADEPKTNLQVISTLQNLCYAIYTSGSTGRPKGVLNTHSGIVNRLLWMQDTYRLSGSDRILQKTPYSFDVSVWEFFWPLMTGARLVMARPDGHKDFSYLVDVIRKEQITTLHFVPSMLAAFLEVEGVDRCTSLKHVFCSGEALPFDVQQRFFQRSKADLYNLYGPTEAAVDVTSWHCSPNDTSSTVSIGRPIANVRIYILDRNMQPMPTGLEGELYIGGIAVARGYLKRPELTAEKFVPDPFSDEPGSRLYKTGDLARFRPDGNIEFIGRIDDQVKIDGVRIELGEIESVIREHPDVRDVRVVVRKDHTGERRLFAYVVPAEERMFSLSDVLSYVRSSLPSHMTPQLVKLDRLPLSANGKLDREALPPPPVRCEDDTTSLVEPQNEVERLLAQLWKDILGVEQVSPHDNFLDIGGHSLLAVQFVSRLQAELGVRIAPREVAFQTLRQLAAVCGERLPHQ
jgi:amino acid adenylation domain-containing protein